jgi:hypothetical protein
MFVKILQWRARGLGAGDKDWPASQPMDTIAASKLQAVASEAGLVAAVDGSLGVLVNLWDHDERLHPHACRSRGRRAN